MFKKTAKFNTFETVFGAFFKTYFTNFINLNGIF